VGGVQSRVALPVEGGLEATVPPVPVPVVPPEPVPVVPPEPVPVVVVPSDAGCDGAGLSRAAVIGDSFADEPRSMTPTEGFTRLGASEDTEPLPEVLVPSIPQAVRASVSRPHTATLRMCELAAKAKFFTGTTPVASKKSPGQSVVRARTTSRSRLAN